MITRHRLSSFTAAALLLPLVPVAESAVIFDFDYSDPTAALWSSEAREVLDNAGKKVASYFVNYTATVTIAVTFSYPQVPV